MTQPVRRPSNAPQPRPWPEPPALGAAYEDVSADRPHHVSVLRPKYLVFSSRQSVALWSGHQQCLAGALPIYFPGSPDLAHVHTVLPTIHYTGQTTPGAGVVTAGHSGPSPLTS